VRGAGSEWFGWTGEPDPEASQRGSLTLAPGDWLLNAVAGARPSRPAVSRCAKSLNIEPFNAGSCRIVVQWRPKFVLGTSEAKDVVLAQQRCQIKLGSQQASFQSNSCFLSPIDLRCRPLPLSSADCGTEGTAASACSSSGPLSLIARHTSSGALPGHHPLDPVHVVQSQWSTAWNGQYTEKWRAWRRVPRSRHASDHASGRRCWCLNPAAELTVWTRMMRHLLHMTHPRIQLWTSQGCVHWIYSLQAILSRANI
jgi:hypothetical protein